jgi:hypothetical protein
MPHGLQLLITIIIIIPQPTPVTLLLHPHLLPSTSPVTLHRPNLTTKFLEKK